MCLPIVVVFTSFLRKLYFIFFVYPHVSKSYTLVMESRTIDRILNVVEKHNVHQEPCTCLCTWTCTHAALVPRICPIAEPIGIYGSKQKCVFSLRTVCCSINQPVSFSSVTEAPTCRFLLFLDIHDSQKWLGWNVKHW